MTDRHKTGKPDGTVEARNILARVKRETGPAASSVLGRTFNRARNHMAGADADPDDRAELWGMRIGRLLSLVALVALVIYLYRFLTQGG